MKKTENIKVNYYFDEAGDPNILGRKGVNLIEKGQASKIFMVGYFESKNPKERVNVKCCGLRFESA